MYKSDFSAASNLGANFTANINLAHPSLNFANSQLLLPSGNSPAMSLMNYTPAPQFSLLRDREPISFHLFNAGYQRDNHYNFFSTPELNPQLPNMAVSTAAMAQDTSVNLLKDHIPGLEKGAFIFNAAKAGQELARNIDKDIDAGFSTGEAITCQTVKSLTDNGLNAVATGAITGGIPVYLTAAAASAAAGNPALALTIPAVGAMLPQAYSNAVAASQIAGNVAEQACHDAFAAARQLSSGGKQ